MRVLVVSNFYPPVVRGGYELECADVVEHLAERHDVLVLTSNSERRRTPRRPQVRRQLDLVPHGPRGALTAPLSTLRAVRTVRRTLDEFEPDIAFVWNGANLPNATLSVLADRGVPMVYRICEHWFAYLYTGDQFMRYLGPVPGRARRAWAPVVRAVNRLPSLRLDSTRQMEATVSWATGALRRQTPTPAAVHPVLERVIHPTTSRVDQLRDLIRNPASTPVIAFIGRLQRSKGPDVAVRAIALMRREHSLDARLVLAGPGDRAARERLLELARREGVADLVTMPGVLERAGIEDLLASAHAVVVPSVWQEPFGMIGVEAAAAGVPVVASDVGGIGEGLRAGEHALLFEPGDAAACAAALTATLTDVEETRARVARAREHTRRFALEDYLLATEEFLADSMRALGKPWDVPLPAAESR